MSEQAGVVAEVRTEDGGDVGSPDAHASGHGPSVASHLGASRGRNTAGGGGSGGPCAGTDWECGLLLFELMTLQPLGKATLRMCLSTASSEAVMPTALALSIQRRTPDTWAVLVQIGPLPGGTSTSDAAPPVRTLALWLVRTSQSAEDIRARAAGGPPEALADGNSLWASSPACLEATLLRVTPCGAIECDWRTFDRFRSEWMFVECRQEGGTTPALLHLGSGNLLPGALPGGMPFMERPFQMARGCLDLRLLWRHSACGRTLHPHALIQRCEEASGEGGGAMFEVTIECWHAASSSCDRDGRDSVFARQTQLLRGWPASPELRALAPAHPEVLRLRMTADGPTLSHAATWRWLVLLTDEGVHLLDFSPHRLRGASSQLLPRRR